MPKREFEIVAVGIEYVCDKCNEGLMEYIGISHGPLGFSHACGRCGDAQIFEQKYPTVEHRRQAKGE